MSPAAYLKALELAIGGGLLLLFVYGPWQKTLIDVARQKLIEARDRIFILAIDGELDIKSKEYRDIRTAFNGMIRYCHVMRFHRLLAVMIGPKIVRHVTIAEIISNIQKESARKKIEHEWREAMHILLAVIVMRSPILVLLTMLLSPLFIIGYLVDKQKISAADSSIKSAIQRDLESETYIGFHQERRVPELA